MSQLSFIDDLANNLKPVQPPPRRLFKVLRLSFLSFLFASVILFLHGLRPDIGPALGRVSFIIEMTLLLTSAVLAFLATASSAIPGELSEGRKKTQIFLGLGAALAFSFTLHGAWMPESFARFMGGYTCGAFIVIGAILPLLWGVFELRRGAPTQTRLSSFFLTGAVFAAGVLLQHLICPADDAPHLLVWHLLPLFGFLGLATYLGPKLIRW